MPKTLVVPIRLQKGRNEITSWSYLEAYAVGKWRPIRAYQTSKPDPRPSKTIMKEVEDRLLRNMGYKEGEATIEFKWYEPVIDDDRQLIKVIR